jgi:small GTP-binding protein
VVFNETTFYMNRKNHPFFAYVIHPQHRRSFSMGTFRDVSAALGVFAAGAIFGAVFHESVKRGSYSLYTSALAVLTLRKKRRSVKTIVLGLDLAGKTTLLYQMKLATFFTVVPTIGYNLERVTSDHVEFTMWDIGGLKKIRPLWRHYFSGIKALIYVIDSADRARFEESVSEFEKLLFEEELKKAPILIYANKQASCHVCLFLYYPSNLKDGYARLCRILQAQCQCSRFRRLWGACRHSELGSGECWLSRRFRHRV